jgi:hypothetical protein
MAFIISPLWPSDIYVVHAIKLLGQHQSLLVAQYLPQQSLVLLALLLFAVYFVDQVLLV